MQEELLSNGFRQEKPALDPIALAQAQQAKEQAEVNEAFRRGITALRDFIAPSSIEFLVPTSRLAPALRAPITFTATRDRFTQAG